MKHILKISFIIIIISFLMLFACGVGLVVAGSGLFSLPSPVRAADQTPRFDLLEQAWQIIDDHFVDRSALNPAQLIHGAIRGMVEALGDEGHSVFLTAEQATRQQSDLSGKFSGIGAQLGLTNHLPVIVAPFDGSPAQKAGIEAGDIVLKVDQQDVTTMPLNEIIDRIRGPEGTQVVLTVLHPDGDKGVDIQITRGEINVPAATWAMIPGTEVGLVRLSEFSARANDDLTTMLKEAKVAGAQALIVDVRNNPGGLLEQAVKVTSQFLSSGNVLLQADADGHQRAFSVQRGGLATNIPLVVLINRGSASSAEIFAGAIQDQLRGQLVGETTFGTGTVLEPFTLKDNSVILLGTSQWLTPKGRVIWKHGIEPDVQVKLPLGTQLLSVDALKGMTPADLWRSSDLQLLKALELLGIQPPPVG